MEESIKHGNVTPRRPSKRMRLIPAEGRVSKIPQEIRKFTAHYKIVGSPKRKSYKPKRCSIENG